MSGSAFSSSGFLLGLVLAELVVAQRGAERQQRRNHLGAHAAGIGRLGDEAGALGLARRDRAERRAPEQ